MSECGLPANVGSMEGLGLAPKCAAMPDSMEIAIADVLEAQFELGVLAGKNGRHSIGPKQCDAAATAIKRMVAEVQVALNDAERYCWLRIRTAGLRDNEGRQYFSFPSMFGLRPVGNIMQGSVGQHLDSAIDADGLGPNPISGAILRPYPG